uniref:Complement factor I n=1 Tax=Eptatretus burgeri TaxID=7764 RepID=A0A8C4R6M5_EPTBU
MAHFWFILTAAVYFSLCSSEHQNVRGHDSEKSMEVHQNAQDVEDSTRQKAWNKHVVPSCLEEKYNDKSCQKVFCHPWERCLQDRCMCLIPNECPRVGGPVCSLGGNRLPSYCKLKSLECLRKNSKYAFSNFMPCSKPRFSIKEERGQLFLQISGDWLPVCANMNMPTANAACRQLGLSLGAKTVQNKKMVSKTNTNSSQAVTKLLCKGWESSLAECQYKLGKYNKCQRLGHIHINCYKEERGCNISEFECANKKCVPRTRMCNGDDDCADRSDELCCQSCSKGALLCSTGNCVAETSLCDGEPDCINYEDEANCTSTKKSKKYDNEVIVQERQNIREAALPVCGNSSFGISSVVLLQPRSSRNRRLIGGTQATQDQFPWQAALLQDRVWTCGAVFIGGNWFLTAAHCVSKVMAEYKVRVGELARLTRETTQDELLIDRIVKHPRYNSRTNKNDVALLFVAKMDHIHLYTPSLTPACIPHSSLQFPPGTQCFASGWGRALELTTLAKRPNVLRWVKLNLIGNCSAFHGERFTEGMECAGSLDGSADTCDGDSGGPLICYNSLNDAYVWGIVSWGHRCGTEGFPGVYAKVAFYYTWIRSITGKDIFKH